MKSQRSELEQRARKFAGEVSDLLNGTITDGPRLRSYMKRDGRAVVGYEVSKISPVGSAIPLTVSKSPPKLRLRVLYDLFLAEDGGHLTTAKSAFSLERDDEPILTFDYVRDPPNEYPEAHIHVHAPADSLKGMLRAVGRPKDGPEALHLPVGGRRYRPCLEDIIEFCILERLVEARPDWAKALNDSRDRYHELQLRAAIARNPELAAEELKRHS